jgi:hypothetical protein
MPVGVGQYQHPGQDLCWADQDAIDQAKFWRSQKGRLFDDVICQGPLLNREATRANILRNRKAIEERVRKGDTVVAPFFGHGLKLLSGEWHFCAADFAHAGGMITGGNLTASELRAWVSRLTQKGVRVLLIIGSCHSGAVNSNVDGAVVLAACQAEEAAWEANLFALKDNSLFNRVLLDALRGKADRNGDGMVTLDEVVDYLNRHLPELCRKNKCEKVQNPKVFRTAKTPGTLPLARVRG